MKPFQAKQNELKTFQLKQFFPSVSNCSLILGKKEAIGCWRVTSTVSYIYKVLVVQPFRQNGTRAFSKGGKLPLYFQQQGQVLEDDFSQKQYGLTYYWLCYKSSNYPHVFSVHRKRKKNILYFFRFVMKKMRFLVVTKAIVPIHQQQGHQFPDLTSKYHKERSSISTFRPFQFHFRTICDNIFQNKISKKLPIESISFYTIPLV